MSQSSNLTAVGVHAPGGAFTLGVLNASFNVLAALGGRSHFGAATHRLNFPDVPWHGPESMWPLGDLAEAAVDLVYSNPAPGKHSHLEACVKAQDTALILRPRAFLLEGPPDWYEPETKHVREWVTRWEESGYLVSLVRWNATQFGIPQRRARVFFAAAEVPLSFNNLAQDAAKWPRAATVDEALSDLMVQPLATDPQAEANYTDVAANSYQVSSRQDAVGLTWHVESPGSPSITRLIPHFMPGQHAKRIDKEILAKTYWLDRTKSTKKEGRPSMYYRRLHPGNPSPRLPGDIRFIHPEFDRFITPREGARLMGVPDWFNFAGTSPSRANLEAARTVPPRVAQLVSARLAECLANPGEDNEHVARFDLSGKTDAE